MSYAAAVDHLYALGHELVPTAPDQPRRKFDLEHMRVLAAALGNPQDTFPSILIAGTNGKGSTAATLSSILVAAGHRTALYTSPHLNRVNERIRIDASPIPDEDFARLYFKVDDVSQRLVSQGALPHHPSFFEYLTALAFLYFASRQVDIAVLEVGMGGRLDATNIVHPILSIITDIALDHQEYLGNTIAEIAREKAGILRPGGTLITLPQHPEANQAIGEAAATLDLHAVNAASFIPHTPVPPQVPQAESPAAAAESAPEPASILPRNRYTLTLGGEALVVDSPLSGHHQQRNIALAIAAAEELRNPSSPNLADRSHPGYEITNAAIEEGIRNTRWPGRLELLTPAEGQPLLLDVAHNPAGAWTLRAAISRLPESMPRTLVFSCLRDKSLTEMAQILFPLFDSSSHRPYDHIVFAPIHNPRAATLDSLQQAARALDIPAHTAPDVASALAQARALTPSNGLILATGSIYLIGEIRQLAT
jgi:dihydrofolate synthase / folylpolyglutamate synthase